jgi:hypothetical protein
MKKADKEKLDACDRHAPYVSLAEKIAEQVAAFNLGAQAAQDPSGVMDLLLADLTEQEIKSLIRAKFDALPAVTRTEMLANTFTGDAVIQSRLIEERARLYAKGQIASNIAELRQDASVYKRCHSAELPRGQLWSSTYMTRVIFRKQVL